MHHLLLLLALASPTAQADDLTAVADDEDLDDDLDWDDDGTQLYLHLAQKVVPGTRAFIAAYLGDAQGVEELDALPSTLLLGEPR